MILFLDFDGVLHPEYVYLENGRPMLKGEGTLFMWAPLLVEALAPFPNVRIVLSTTWVRRRGFHRAKKVLPDALARRVVGATWHTDMLHMGWGEHTRYGQIAGHVMRAHLSDWVAIDDDDYGWQDSARERLVHTDGVLGLSGPGAVQELQEKLRRFGQSAPGGLLY
jgi:hypothetical protein